MAAGDGGGVVTRVGMERRRLGAAQFLRDGGSQADAARIYLVSRTTANRWARALSTGGTLEARRAPGRPCRLSGEQLRSLYALWETRERWTSETFTAAIRTALGVQYDPDHVGRMMIRLGLREKRARRGAQMELVEELAGGSACPTTEGARG